MISHWIARTLRAVAKRIDGPTTIHTHVHIDGREVARAIAGGHRGSGGTPVR